ncbi:MAG: alpha/beta hydrolase [Ignavibacteria bacterium]|nr:alpha/beta hydrolase [Ignavibacteria bacterium]
MNTLHKPASGFKKRFLKITLISFLSLLLLAISVYIWFQVSPYPSAWLIRRAFTKDGIKLNEELAKHTPQGVKQELDIQFSPGDNDAFMDIYYPEDLSGRSALPLIVWTHGGAFIAGDKSEIANYCKILASKGYIVAAVNYSLAPGKNYPVPVEQVNKALGFLQKNAAKYKINPGSIFLAGDSGGAHISAQLAAVLTDNTYAAMLNIQPAVEPAAIKGVILYCGPYNSALVNFDGAMGGFLKTVLWSYMGSKDFMNDPKMGSFSVTNFVKGTFPKAYISVGNHDPLKPHSFELARKLSAAGVITDTLFFPEDYSPGLPHEYQFTLDNEAGMTALSRMVDFLKRNE